jgi:hypothetical protein
MSRVHILYGVSVRRGGMALEILPKNESKGQWDGSGNSEPPDERLIAGLRYAHASNSKPKDYEGKTNRGRVN